MKRFLSEEECGRISRAIGEAERKSSGEIRIHIDNKCPGDPKERAFRTFHSLRMEMTAARNGVLIYVSPSDRKLAVIGDKGINKVVPAGFWKEVCDALAKSFSEGRFVSGLCEGVLKVGEKLKEYFPYSEDDENELPDEVTFGSVVDNDSGK